MLSVYRKEMRSYLTSPIPYVLVIIFAVFIPIVTLRYALFVRAFIGVGVSFLTRLPAARSVCAPSV